MRTAALWISPEEPLSNTGVAGGVVSADTATGANGITTKAAASVKMASKRPVRRTDMNESAMSIGYLQYPALSGNDITLSIDRITEAITHYVLVVIANVRFDWRS